ncbi:MAG: heat-inducible transcription repressor HrcA, partial [Bacilli bacterium]|nr:heat-inducible transcription repressor HrcA [Bacilli bacterium]
SDINEIIDTKVRVTLQNELSNYEELLDAFFNAFMKFATDNVYISGKNNMIALPDFDDIEKIRYFLKIIEDHDFFEMLANSDNFSVRIGEGNEIISSENISVITSKYHIDDVETGVIAIIGPTRMDYNKVIHLVNFVAKKINEINKEPRGEISE